MPRPKPAAEPTTVDTPWAAMDEAAAYLRYRSVTAPSVARILLQRNNIPLYRRNGKAWLVRKVDLNEWVETGDCREGRRHKLECVRRSLARGVDPEQPLDGGNPRRRRHPRVERLERDEVAVSIDGCRAQAAEGEPDGE